MKWQQPWVGAYVPDHSTYGMLIANLTSTSDGDQNKNLKVSKESMFTQVNSDMKMLQQQSYCTSHGTKGN